MPAAFPWTFPVNFGVDVPPVNPGENVFVTVKINNAVVTNVISTEIERGVSKRFDRATIVILNQNGVRTRMYQPYQDVEIVTWDSVTLFKGRLVASRPTEKQRIEVKADDYSAKLIDRQVDKTYTDVAITTIIQDLIDTYYTDITYTNVAAIAKTVSARFNNISVQDCLVYLADIAYTNGADFYIDEDKDLHFFESQTRSSGITLKNAPSGQNLMAWDFPEEATTIYNKVTGSGNFYPFTYTANDTISQNAYGIREMPLLIDRSARTLQDVTDRVDRTLLRYKEPYITGILTVKVASAQDIRPGELVYVDITNSGLSSGNYIVTGMTMNYPPNRARVQVSEWFVDLMDIWAELIKEMRRTAFKSVDLTENFELYSNHLGNVDNFMTTALGGAGTATENAAAHRMDLVSPTGGWSYAVYRTKKLWSFSQVPIITTFIVDNLVLAGGAIIGFCDLWSSYSYCNWAGIWYINGEWNLGCGNTIETIFHLGTIPGIISNGDQITLIVTSTKLFVYVNDVLRRSLESTHIPTIPLRCGCSVYSTTASSISVDFISIKSFKQI